MAQNVGKIFEKDFSSSCPSDMFIYRVPDIRYGVKSICWHGSVAGTWDIWRKNW